VNNLNNCRPPPKKTNNDKNIPAGCDFVTRKITVGLKKILSGEEAFLRMGNLDSIRDWGHARDYVHAMWLMLQAKTPDDYVIATGECHSVREFIELSFAKCGMVLTWHGKGVDEVAVDQSGILRIKIDPHYFRPVEVSYLEGDNSKARLKLNWSPTCTFNELVSEMVQSDCSM